MKAEIQDKYYYIIKVNNKKKTYFKIGEACKRSRPESLVSKYSKYTGNTAELLAFEKLPRNNKKRLNDKTIHNKLLAENNFKQANEFEIQVALGEVDGKKEFFEALNNSADICAEVEEIVKNCTKKDYTANVKYVYNLNYTNQKHLVNDDLITKIKENFSEVDNILNTTNNNIMLIGQFEPDFVASYAMYNNITIWHDAADQKVVYKYESLNNKIKYFEGTLEEFIEENMDTVMDLILCNSPYGRIGAEITKAIIDNINFKTYINLLPANDYKRVPELWQYQSDMEPCNDAFDDATVTTHMAKIHKNKVNNMSLSDYEISNYVDPRLDKYFKENVKRSHYAIDVNNTWMDLDTDTNIDTIVILDHRHLAHGGLAKSKDTAEYRWNVLKNINCQWLYDNILKPSKNYTTSAHKVNKYVINFKQPIEKDNFVAFLYSADGFKFFKKVVCALNKDSTEYTSKYLPKVDWTRSWTVEEILKEYNYTDEEIKEVMEDLKNFKGMND